MERQASDASDGADGFRIFVDQSQFTWTCPTCGRGYYGILADEPVSGWDAPRWRLTEGPTLTPSLGCQGLRDGSCTGHWWLRDGKLVAA